MRLASTITAILAITLVSGCAATSSAPATDPHRYGELVVGSATKEDAAAKLGPPNSVSNYPDGNVLLQWIDVYSSHPIHVALLFGPDGKLIRVQQVFTQ